MRKLHVGKSVVRPWLAECCTFKEQAVLLSALRGCDGIPKEDISKKFTRKLRSILFYPAMMNLMENDADKYMKTVLEPSDINHLQKNLDHYPNHWVTHFAHACEIIGYKHPDPRIAGFWGTIYQKIVDGMHLNVETCNQLDERLADQKDWFPLKDDLITRE